MSSPSKPTNEEILRDYDLTGLVPGWYFRKVSLPSDTYRIDAADLNGYSFSMSGKDPDDLLQRCVKSADLHYRGIHGLTGLPVRRRMKQRLAEISGSRSPGDYPVTVVLLNPDRFIYVNDGLGHGEADRILRRIAEMLCALGERFGTIIYQTAGSEWGAIFTQSDVAKVRRFAADAKTGMHRLGIRYGHPEQKQLTDKLITLSVGVATTNEVGADATALLKAADDDLCRNKRDRV